MCSRFWSPLRIIQRSVAMDFAAGLGVMAVSLWLLFDQQLYLQNIGADQTDYFIGTYIILGVGGVMTLVGNVAAFRSQFVSQSLNETTDFQDFWGAAARGRNLRGCSER